MIDLSILGILEWALLKGASLHLSPSQSASNLLLALYCLVFVFNRKAAFLVAFLLAEIYGNCNLFSSLTNPQYYLGYVFIYTMTYWYVFKRYQVVKALLGYVTLIIFELTMSLDAILYAETETVIYNSYTYIIVFVHLYIIISLFEWKRIKYNMGVFARSLLCTFWPSYNYSLFCYTKAYSTSGKEIR